MKTHSKIAYQQPPYQEIIDMAKRIPVIAIMGHGKKTTSSVLITLALKQSGIKVQLCNLDKNAIIPSRLINTTPADLIVVNCPAYNPSAAVESIAVCSKIAAVAKIKLLTIANKSHHLPYTFNLLMGMIRSLNTSTNYYYVFIEQDNAKDGTIDKNRLREELDVLTDLKPCPKVKFEQLESITLSQAIHQYVKNDCPPASVAMAIKPYQSIVQKLLNLI